MKFEVDTYTEYDFTQSSMTENRELLYDLVKTTKPKRIIELGTYYGCSYFSFAQAIKDNNLDCHLTGIDAWRGDEHTGHYDLNVFSSFNHLRNKHFNDKHFDYIKDTFTNAKDQIEDNSVDILMIDGTHTYEAVKEDFESYLPKLKENSIVLFHDVEESRFGCGDFYRELTQQHKFFTFRNRHGLGVIFIKPLRFYEPLMKYLYTSDTVVLSSIMGDKDDIQQQPRQTRFADYKLWTDKPQQDKNGWSLIQMKIKGSPRRLSRLPKIQQDFYGLDKYEYNVWIDGHVKFKDQHSLQRLITELGDYDIALFKHPRRTNIKDEMKECINQNKLKGKDIYTAMKQIQRYKQEGLPQDYGLWAGTVIVRRNNQRTQAFNKLWWEEYDNGCERDQISLPYVLWRISREGLKIRTINKDIYDNDIFIYGTHKK